MLEMIYLGVNQNKLFQSIQLEFTYIRIII